MWIFRFASHQRCNPQLSEPILLQASIEGASAQAQSLCCFACVTVISCQRFFDQKRLYFFQTHFFEITRFAAASRQTKIPCADLLILCHKYSALDDMIQFAHVPRESMLQQTLARAFVETANLFPVPFCVLTQKAVRQRHNVLTSIAQRRQFDLNCIEAKKQILPKTT